MKFRKLGAIYAVEVEGNAVGFVWRSTSGQIWGSLSCTPALAVWAWKRHAPGPIEGSAETRRAAATQLMRALGAG